MSPSMARLILHVLQNARPRGRRSLHAHVDCFEALGIRDVGGFETEGPSHEPTWQDSPKPRMPPPGGGYPGDELLYKFGIGPMRGKFFP